MPAVIRQFPCLSDNYGVLLHDPSTGATAAIDAPEAAKIIEALQGQGWTLTDILITHHHADHVQGVERLKAVFPNAVVVGPKAEADRIPMVQRLVSDGDTAHIGSLAARVIATPGHTAGHVVYHFADERLLFAGDTLFAMGCGRVFETEPETMWASLQKLKTLPPETVVYCGHEYTASNARFAASLSPDDPIVLAQLKEAEALRAAGEPTLPTTIALELRSNPFLRADEASLKAAIGMSNASDASVFAELRARKNRF